MSTHYFFGFKPLFVCSKKIKIILKSKNCVLIGYNIYLLSSYFLNDQIKLIHQGKKQDEKFDASLKNLKFSNFCDRTVNRAGYEFFWFFVENYRRLAPNKRNFKIMTIMMYVAGDFYESDSMSLKGMHA